MKSSSVTTFPPLNPVSDHHDPLHSHDVAIRFGGPYDRNHIELSFIATGTLTNQDEHVIEFGSSDGQNKLESPIITTPHPNEYTTGFHQSITIRDDNDNEEDGEGVAGVEFEVEVETEGRGEEEREVEGGGGGGEEEREVERGGVGEEEIEAEVEVGGGGAEGQVEVEVEGDLGDHPGINRLTNSKVSSYALIIVATMFGIVTGILKQGKHSLHFAKAHMLIFVVSFGSGYVAYTIYSWVTDHSACKTFKGLYYICCNVAFISVLLMLYTTA